MGVLDNPVVPQLSAAEHAAQQLKQQTRMTYQQLVTAFNTGAYAFWKNPRAKPSEVAAALGADAKEVFELHGKLGALLAEVNPAAIQPGASVVGAFTVNADGTVTAVDPAPAS